MMTFDEVTFPETLMGVTGGPNFMLVILTTRQGKEYRISNTNNQVHEFDATPLLRDEASIQTLTEFIAARNGSARGFRFRDWTDYTTALDDVSEPVSSSSCGEVVLEGGEHRLYKRYEDGNGYSYDRRIFKPRAASFTLKSGASVVDPGDYTLDTGRGIITFPGAAPADLSWHGYFDVPVHFTSDTDDLQSLTIADFKNATIACAMKEMLLVDGALSWETDTPIYPTVDGGGTPGGGSPGGGSPGGGSGGGGGGNPGSPEDPDDPSTVFETCEELIASKGTFTLTATIDAESISVSMPYDSGLGYWKGLQSGGPYDGWQGSVECVGGNIVVTFTYAPPANCEGWQGQITGIVSSGSPTFGAFSNGICGGTPPTETMTGSIS